MTDLTAFLSRDTRTSCKIQGSSSSGIPIRIQYQMQIRPLHQRDLESLVEIHHARFPSHRSTSLGRPFLRRMYGWFLRHHPAFCLVAEDNGQVQGFIVAAVGGYGRPIFRYSLLQIAWGLGLNPRVVLKRSTFHLWRMYLRALLPQRKKNRATNPSPVCLSLASMAVTESAGSAGLFLLAEVEKTARRERIGSIAATVENNNPKVIRLYSKLGYSIDSRNHDSVLFRKTL